MEKIKEVKQNYQQSWMSIKGVVGVGIGPTSDGSVGLIISVKENAAKIRKRIPVKIEEVTVDIQETGEFKAL
ncbi:MAG: hypothetical protein P8184_09325 [Calditrichia bacterium]